MIELLRRFVPTDPPPEELIRTIWDPEIVPGYPVGARMKIIDGVLSRWWVVTSIRKVTVQHSHPTEGRDVHRFAWEVWGRRARHLHLTTPRRRSTDG